MHDFSSIKLNQSLRLKHKRSIELRHIVFTDNLTLVIFLYPINPFHVVWSIISIISFLLNNENLYAILLLFVTILPLIISMRLALIIAVPVWLFAIVLSIKRGLSKVRLVSYACLIALVVLVIRSGVCDFMQFALWLLSNHWAAPLYIVALVNVLTINICAKLLEKARFELEFIPLLYFMEFLILASILLIAGKEYWANKVAEIAYYNLVLGVIICLVRLSEEEKKQRE